MHLSFSRRDFLKAASAGLLGVFLADLRLARVLAAEVPKQGRSTLSGIEVLSEPFFTAIPQRALGKDEVVAISAVVQGDRGYGNSL